MKRIALILCVASAVLFACNSADKKEDNKETSKDTVSTSANEAWVPVDSATEMKAWMEYATPGEAHKMLSSLNGTWNGDVTMWMSADAPPMKSTSSITNKMVMDGRYQVSDYKGDMMGMPFVGMSTTGYDNTKKHFVSTWIDNMGTGVLKMEGNWDEGSKTLSLDGKMNNPANNKECDMKESLKIIDANTHVMEMWGTDSKTGKLYKNMEVKYTRKS